MASADFPFSRRTLLQLAAGTSMSWLLGCTNAVRRPDGLVDDGAEWMKRYGPVDRTPSGDDVFAADEAAEAHALLWNREARDFDRAPSESIAVAILGGGMSGLLSAYLLRDLSPVVLEHAPRFGGQSRSESWDELEYPLGAAYVSEPDAGSDAGAIFRELDVASFCRPRGGGDAVFVGGKIVDGWWQGAADPGAKAAFVRVARYLADTLNEQGDLRFPTMPARTDAARALLRKLDGESLAVHLKRLFPRNERMPTLLETYLDRYCHSTFGAFADEVSAAAGLNFLASEFGPVLVPSGGNGRIAEAILEKLYYQLPADRLRPKSTVVSVRKHPNGHAIDYVDGTGKSRRIIAKHVVVTVPKYVALRLFADLPPERHTAFRSIEYRAYVVANVRLRGRPERSDYDVFRLDGKPLENPPSVDAAVTTDIVRATFAAAVGKDARPPVRRTEVLTFFRALPFSGARPELLAPGALEKLRHSFERELESYLPALGISPDTVLGIRLARWGHAMPVPKVGVYRAELPHQLSASWDGTVHFANQDNWCLPAFETAMDEALRVAPVVRKALLPA